MTTIKVKQHPESRTSTRQRLIFINLLLLFLLTIVVSVVAIQRQLSIEDHARFVDEQFRIGSLFSALSESHLDIQQLLLLHNGQSSHDVEQFGRDYDKLRQLIEAQITTLQEDRFVIDLGETAQASLTQYVVTWQELDDILSQEPKRAYDLIQLAFLSGYLSKMESLMGNLFEVTEANMTGAHWLWDQHARTLRNSLIGAMVLFLLLVAWTLYLFWQFIKEYQAIASAFQTSELRHRVLLETIPDVVLRRTRSGIYTDFKPAKTFGDFLPSADFIGKHVSEILPPEIAKLSTAAAERALDSGQEQTYEYRMPKRLTGVISDFEARVIPSGNDEVQVIVRDITADKVESERQQQAQRLESLGILAGGIAHDFNNLLTSMMAQLSWAQLKLQRNELPIGQVDKALVATERAADLTRQLLAYAGKGHAQVVALDLNQLIGDNQGMLETALPNRSELQITLAKNLPLIEADRGHIQQVVMNIALNAAEALQPKKSGQSDGAPDVDNPNQSPTPQPHASALAQSIPCVRIVTALEEITTKPLRPNAMGHDLQPGRYVVLRIQDNGIGMDEEIIKRIFDPFFSTKKRGHGLGLAATLGIVRSYRGSIFVDSQPGVGTTFNVFFPAIQSELSRSDEEAADNAEVSEAEATEAEAPAAVEEEAAAAVEQSPASTAPTILVIDDENFVREVVIDILEGEGFRLLQASNGQDGIAQVQRYPNEIDLVLLDMKMPGLSGGETLKILHEIEPTLKVILSSGYSEHEIAPFLQSTAAIDFLAKPYQLEQLIERVNRGLATPYP